MHYIEDLSLAQNNLRGLPSTLRDLTSMERLNIEENAITDIAQEVRPWPALSL